MHRLITLAFSHYNEKARWALERYAVPFQEEPYLPFFCSMAVAISTRGRGGAADRTSSRSCRRSMPWTRKQETWSKRTEPIRQGSLRFACSPKSAALFLARSSQKEPRRRRERRGSHFGTEWPRRESPRPQSRPRLESSRLARIARRANRICRHETPKKEQRQSATRPVAVRNPSGTWGATQRGARHERMGREEARQGH